MGSVRAKRIPTGRENVQAIMRMLRLNHSWWFLSGFGENPPGWASLSSWLTSPREPPLLAACLGAEGKECVFATSIADERAPAALTETSEPSSQCHMYANHVLYE